MSNHTTAPAGVHTLSAWPGKCPEWVASAADLPEAPLVPTDRPELLKAMAYPGDTLADDVAAFRAGNWDNFLEGLADVEFALRHRIPTFFGSWYLRRVDGEGQVSDFGLYSMRVVTTVGVQKMVDGLHGGDPTTYANFKYHGIGVGVATAEASANTDLETAVNADLVTAGQRAAGSQTEGSAANVYRTAAVVSIGLVTSALSITEEGIFSAQTVGSGTMLDRTRHTGSPVSMDDNASAQSTYDLTLAAGG